MKKIISKYKYISFIIIILLVYIMIPVPRFDDPTSTVVYSSEGILLGAKIADDEQWRFPKLDSVPEKVGQSIVLFEDRCFKYHPGFNPVSLCRSLWLNIKHGKVISGGSTITMQVVRLARKGKPRTIWEKLIEIFYATKLEWKYSKDEILALYLSNAPFGGNVVGIEAASWRYYGRGPDLLSWAEAATLAILPNAPSLIFPGKNQDLLLKKRNFLLYKLFYFNKIDSLTYSLSLQESLPGPPRLLPHMAQHLTSRCYHYNRGKKVNTTIVEPFQNRINRIIEQHCKQLSANEIHNIAVLVVEVKTANIVTYIGNTVNSDEHANDVDIITAPRSTGSILKPFLYASMLQDGELLPSMLVPDIPMFIDGFSPKNYSLGYDGAVPAWKALARSLNVPAVHMLSRYGVEKFRDRLNQIDFSTIRYPADHYGLSLILGGAEATLWDLCSAYTGMARILSNTVERNYLYSENDWCALNFIRKKSKKEIKSNTETTTTSSLFTAASVWFTLEALLEVNRPDDESGWKSFSSAKKIAWKTGTSFGFRDAWAIGITKDYIVGVWVGNADGEGRPGLIGTIAAAPVMFDIFNQLELTGWFLKPYAEIIKVPVCKQSGFLPSVNCNDLDTIEIPETGLRTKPCPFHKIIHLDKSEKYRVHNHCENAENIIQKSWFVLPPAMEYFYKMKNPFYLPLPPYKTDCKEVSQEEIMEFIYPEEGSKIYIPKDFSGSRGKTIFEVAHRNQESEIFWHIDNQYIGKTKNFHQMAVNPELGLHKITVVDQDGNTISRNIEIVSKSN